MCFGVDHSRGFFSFQQQKRSQQCENGKDNRHKEPYLQVVAEHAGNEAYKRGACRTARDLPRGPAVQTTSFPRRATLLPQRRKFPAKVSLQTGRIRAQPRRFKTGTGGSAIEQIRADAPDRADDEEFFEGDSSEATSRRIPDTMPIQYGERHRDPPGRPAILETPRPSSAKADAHCAIRQLLGSARADHQHRQSTQKTPFFARERKAGRPLRSSACGSE